MSHQVSRRSFLKSLGVAAVSHGIGLTGLSGLALGLSGRASAQDMPRLVYLFPGGAQPDVAKVQEALSAYMAERIGATIELRAVEWGAFDNQISLINASAEKYDLAFTAPWINNYYTNVSQEYLSSLEDLLPKLAPGYFASLTPTMWEAARVGGHIYGGINQQIFVKPFGPYVRSDVMDAIGLKDEFMKLTKWDDLDPILKAVYEYVQKDDVLTHVSYNLAQLLTAESWNFDPQDTMLVVRSDDPKAKVLIFSETDEYRHAAEMVRSWYKAGYSPADAAQWSEMDAAWQAGLYAVRISDIVKPGGEAEVAARWGQAVVAKAIAEPVLTTGGVTATMNGVSSVSENPELAVKFLELLNTDPVFYNMLCKGLEGVHWEWADKAKLLIKPAGGKASFGDTGYNPNTDWMYGNVFNSYYTDESQVGAWPATAELNRNARPSPVLGFTFDRKPVETETASISAVTQEYASPLGGGIVDTKDGISKLNQALKDAGIERVRDEMQKQIDAWLAAKA